MWDELLLWVVLSYTQPRYGAETSHHHHAPPPHIVLCAQIRRPEHILISADHLLQSNYPPKGGLLCVSNGCQCKEEQLIRKGSTIIRVQSTVWWVRGGGGCDRVNAFSCFSCSVLSFGFQWNLINNIWQLHLHLYLNFNSILDCIPAPDHISPCFPSGWKIGTHQEQEAIDSNKF